MPFFLLLLFVTSIYAKDAEYKIEDDRIVFLYDEKQKELNSIGSSTFTRTNEFTRPSKSEISLSTTTTAHEYREIKKGDKGPLLNLIKQRWHEYEFLLFLQEQIQEDLSGMIADAKNRLDTLLALYDKK